MDCDPCPGLVPSLPFSVCVWGKLNKQGRGGWRLGGACLWLRMKNGRRQITNQRPPPHTRVQLYIGAPPAKKQWTPEPSTPVAQLMTRAGNEKGIVMNHTTQRWYRALNVQGMVYRGDKCCPRSTTSCMVLLHESPAYLRAWGKHRVNHPHVQLCNPLAIVAGFVQLEEAAQPFALVRVVPPELAVPHDRLRCRMVVGWKTYLALANDPQLTAQLVPVSDIQAQTVVVNCSGDRLAPTEPTSKPALRAWRRSHHAALGVVPYM